MKVQLTTLENTVVVYSLDRLSDWIGCEGYTDLDTKEISKYTGIEIKKLRGVLASLQQKEVMESYEHDTQEDWSKPSKWITLWSFVNQVDESESGIKERCQIS